MSLTLKKFRELTENLNEDTIINTTIEFGNPNSIRGTINQVHIVPKEHSYANENHIILTQSKDPNFTVKKWVAKNTPITVE